jgi:N-methylhydantoinase A
VAQWSIGIDTGGTFTDLAAVDHHSGELHVVKVPSTPLDPAEGILAALDQFSAARGVPFDEISFLAHGTTVATNALLEGCGAKAGLLITAGFRAIYPARSGTRPRGADLINPAYRKAEPLVPLERTFEVTERIGFDGGVIAPLDEESVRRAARDLRAAGCQSVAICFLFSFMNESHERRTAEIIQQECPEIRISLSSEVLPVIREFPRMSTVVLDAYVGPIVSAYFRQLSNQAGKRGLDSDRLFIMQSNGGLMRLNVAAAFPNETLLSGPAAGLSFATALARQCDHPNIVTFDMGGTSTDTCLVRDSQATSVNSGLIAGQELGTSMIEIRTVGAGGGAIAHLGEDGLLKVGPRSAGARPGPACYGHGGTEPTVTDANVVLGYIDAGRFLGGQLQGSKSLALEALDRLGGSLGMSGLEAAIGVRRVVNSHMASALRVHITEKGCDPRDFTLLAFGGSGPLHGVEIAAELGIRKVVVPSHPGVSCAMGLLLTDVKHVYVRSLPQRLATATADAFNAAFQILEQKARDDAVREGFGADAPLLSRQFDMRYTHQGYQLTVEAPDRLTEADFPVLRGRFDQIHEGKYGTCAPGEEVEIVTIRVNSIVALPKLPLSASGSGDRAQPAPTGFRQAYFQTVRDFVKTPVYRRDSLSPGIRLSGPLIVEQLDSTTILAPGDGLEVDGTGNLVISVATRQESFA